MSAVVIFFASLINSSTDMDNNTSAFGAGKTPVTPDNIEEYVNSILANPELAVNFSDAGQEGKNWLEKLVSLFPGVCDASTFAGMLEPFKDGITEEQYL